MKKQLLTISFLIFAFISFANNRFIRVFTDNNTPFYIFLNGIKQNQNPTTNFQMNGLINDSYHLRIKFTSPFFSSIYKHVKLIDDYGNRGNVTYKIEKNFHGNMTLRFVQFDITQNYSSPTDCGEDHHSNNYYSNTTIIQNGNGNTVITQSSTSINNPAHNGTVNLGSICNNTHPSNFQNMLKAIDDETFSDDQLALAKRITRQNCLTANQIKKIALIFSFEATRLSYLKFAYSFCHDKNNYWVVNDALTFSSSKRELNEYIN